MIVLSESPDPAHSPEQYRDLAISTEIAQVMGFQTYLLLSNAHQGSEVLKYVHAQHEMTAGIWLGHTPEPNHYAVIYQAALQKKICFLNTPEQHRTVQAFDQSYARLEALMPESLVITTAAECEAAIAQLGLPLSILPPKHLRKYFTIPAVIHSLSKLQHWIGQFNTLAPEPLGVLVRRPIKLQHSQSSPEGFPFGRQFRLFLHQQVVLTYGYCWAIDDPLKWLSVEEEAQMFTAALTAAQRLEVPFVAIDVGQLDDGRWIVLETGDAQFSLNRHMPLVHFWQEMRQIDGLKIDTLKDDRG